MENLISSFKSKLYSIRFTLTAVVALLILLSVFFTSILSYSRYSKEFQKQSSKQIQQTIELLSINLQSYLDELFRLSGYLYYDDNVVAAIETRGGTVLEKLKQRRLIEDYINQIIIMPRNDIVNVFIITDDIYYSGNFAKGIDQNVDYTQLDWYQKAMNSKDPIYVSPHQEQLVTKPKETVFSVVRQLRSVQVIDKVIGVIKVDASYQGISQIASKIDIGKNGGLIIFDDNKNLVYCDADQQMADQLKEQLDRSEASWTMRINQADVLINKTGVADANWTIISVHALSDLNEGAHQIHRFILFLTALCSLTAIIVLLIFTRRFLRPIYEIVSLMRQVRTGNYQVRFSGTRKDEIGYLGESFNTMVRDINENIEKNTELTAQIYEIKMLNTEAQLRALQSQIKPHFIYNTLNMISMQVQLGKTEQAVDNIKRLHSLLRSIAKWDTEITVQQEFDTIDAYLGIQRNRFEQRLEYTLTLEEQLSSQSILAFILQPIVENAVIHGCEPVRRKTLIEVNGSLQNGCAVFTVKDDGAGISPRQLEQLRQDLELHELTAEPQSASDTGEHIGIKNVNRRIRLYYGEPYGIAVDSIPDKGTVFTIILPLRKEESQKC